MRTRKARRLRFEPTTPRGRHFFDTSRVPTRVQKNVHALSKDARTPRGDMQSASGTTPPPATTSYASFDSVLKHACERPSYENALARRVCVPVVAALLSGAVLVMLAPPFVCKSGGGIATARLCPVRILCWVVLTAVVTAVLTGSRVFRRPS